jgi:hypothetical protein
MPYFNPAFTGAEDYALKAGSNLTLRYGVLVAPAQLDAADVERHWKAFSGPGIVRSDSMGVHECGWKASAGRPS